MLELRGIKKDYFVDKQPVPALKGIDLCFSDAGFVSVLGPSGCGKTTLLNIIGGLDHYSEGDLLIDKKSTKEFTDREWDAYRNERVGFVFQSYNLIPHMSVLANVEVGLMLNGVRKAQRRERALKALESVGLKDEAKKKPNQLSGGQMQRVALARAIVNEPKIILADEPTGALDSTTSVQVMEILKEVSKTKLVIMVTHNRELAEQYSERIIEMKDGEITKDSAPLEFASDETEGKEINKKTSMSFLTALKSSFGNIRTKKGRTIMTAIASSIGIIGVALVLSVSNGFSNYVANVERSVASAVPISIIPTTYTYSGSITVEYENYPDDEFVNVYDSSSTSILKVHQNKFTQEYYDYLQALLNDPVKSKWVDSILFNRVNQDFHLLTKVGNYIFQPNQYRSAGFGGSLINSATGLPNYIFHELFGEKESITEWYDVIAGKYPTAKDEIVLIVDRANCVDQSTLYNLGFLDPDNAVGEKQISFDDVLNKTYKVYRSVDWYGNDEYKTIEKKVYEIDQFNTETFQLEGHESTQEIHYFQRTHGFGDVYNHDELYHPLELKVVGILRPSPTSYINLMPSSLGYTTALKDYMSADGTDDPDAAVAAANQALDKKIKEAASTNVFLSKPDEFSNTDGLNVLNNYFSSINAKGKGESHTLQEILSLIQSGQSSQLDESDTNKLATAVSGLSSALSNALDFTTYWAESNATKPNTVSLNNFLVNCQKVGAELRQDTVTLDATMDSIAALFVKYGGFENFFKNAPKSFFNQFANLERSNPAAIDYLALMNQFSIVSSILIFPSSLTVKEDLTNYLSAYNHYNYDLSMSERPENEQILYSDIMGTFTESLSVLINVISVVLIVFASISLVVSSIMTGIITYVSVVERTKEIGILRACGARKKDVGRLFEAECVIIGTLAGAIGILLTILIDLPIGRIIDALYPGNNLATIASLNPWHALVLLALAILLAFVSGLVPARIAAKKDPVTALRTE